VLSRRQAEALGIGRRGLDHRLATGRWRRILPHTYLTSDVLVLVPSTLGPRSTAWVRVRRTVRLPAPVSAAVPGPGDTRRYLRCAPVARAVADLALESTRLDDVRALVAQAVRGRHCTLAELHSELEAGPRNRSSRLRQALAGVSAGAWSAPEARAAATLRRAGIVDFDQNVALHIAGRRLVVDFLWRRRRAVLEIDSVEHHLDPADWRRTLDRHLALTTAGFSVIHRTPRDVMIDPARFVADVVAWLANLPR
jgi:very-short-patch-repair endonuclease